MIPKNPGGRLPPHVWLVTVLLSLVGGFNYLDRLLIMTMHQSVVAAIPMTDAQFGLLTLVFLLVYAVLSPVTGFLADRFSRKWVIIGSLAAWSAITLATPAATTFRELLVSRILLGAFQAAYLPAALALIADYHRGPTRSIATGIQIGGVMVGTALSGYGGWFADRHSWGYAFIVFGLAGLAYCGILLCTVRDIPREGVDEIPGAAAAPPARFFEALASLFTSGAFLLALSFWGLRGFVGWVIRNWMPTYMQEHFHLSQGTSGFTAMAYPTAAGVLGIIIGGLWSDRWSRTNPRARIYVTAIGLCLSAPGVLMTVNTNILFIAILGFIFHGLTGSFADTNMMPILCMVADPRYRATGYGILNAFASIIGGLSIYAGGALRDAHVDLSLIFQLAAGSLLVCAVLLLLVKQRDPASLPAP